MTITFTFLNTLYQVSFYSFFVFFSGVLVFSLGGFILYQNWRLRNHIAFFLIGLSGFLWLTGTALQVSSTSKEISLLFMRYYTNYGVFFIAPSVYLFSIFWTGFSSRLQRFWATFGFLLAFLFCILISRTNLIFSDMIQLPWGYWPTSGRFRNIYHLYFFVYYISSFANFYRGYLKEQNELRKKHFKAIMIAFAIALLGSIDYLPEFGFRILPFGFIFIISFFIVIFYSIIHYKLMDIETVIHKTLMWLVASSIVFVPIVLLSYWLYPWYREARPLKVALLCGVIFFFLTLYLKLIQPKIDHFFQRRKYDLERASEKFTSDLVHLKSPAELIKKIRDTIKETLYTEKISVFLYNDKLKKFSLVNNDILDQITELSLEDAFLNWLSKNDNIVYRDFVEIDPEYKSIRNQARDYFKKTETIVTVPLVLDKNPLGFINLKKKSNLKHYSAYDFQFLRRLKNESTIALSNSLLYGRVEEEVQLRTNELIQTQKQLIQAEKLATVGTLAGGVAHEINNPLAAILTNAQMLLMDAENKQDKESLKLIEEAAKRCRSIVQKLMVYSRKPLGTREITKVDLEKALSNALSFLGYQLTQENIKVATKLTNAPFIIQGSQNELEQVFTNLILNAKDAIKHAKKSGQIDIFITRQDKQIVIKVKDDGIGIPKEHLSKVFDPFFTTKDVGKGTGLGLSICQSIIEGHKGAITVDSHEGEGSIFIVTLPTLT